MRPWLPVILVLSIFSVSAFFPASLLERVPLCIFHQVTGWDCPGCGLTHAFIALFHGELRQAVADNALAVPMALFLCLYALGKFRAAQSGEMPQWFSPSGSRWVGALLLTLILGQWTFKTALHLWERL